MKKDDEKADNKSIEKVVPVKGTIKARKVEPAKIVDDIDRAVSEELHHQELQSKAFRLRLKILNKMMNEVILCAGVADMQMAYTAEVDYVLRELLFVAREDEDSPAMDVMLAAQIAILVAWRLTQAAALAADRKFDPASKESPDDPLYI